MSAFRECKIPDRVFSRASPSPYYRRLLEFYTEMHSDGYVKEMPAKHGRTGRKSIVGRLQRAGQRLAAGLPKGMRRSPKTIKERKDVAFPGKKMMKYAANIRALAQEHDARTCLDYGAGRGGHYGQPVTDPETGKVYASLQEYWGFDEVGTYEPGLGDELSGHGYDCVITADVLEHCFRADVPWIVEELFQNARKFVFAHIACNQSFGRLPNGEDMHTTVRPAEWWHGVFEATANRYPGIDFELTTTVRDRPQGKKRRSIFRRERYETEIGKGSHFVR